MKPKLGSRVCDGIGTGTVAGTDGSMVLVLFDDERDPDWFDGNGFHLLDPAKKVDIELCEWTRLAEVDRYAWFHGIDRAEAIKRLVNSGLSVLP